MANLKSISHRCYLFDIAFVWELTKETVHLPLGSLQGGFGKTQASHKRKLAKCSNESNKLKPPWRHPGANLKSISHRCHPILVAFVWELTQEIIDLHLGCLQGGVGTPGLARSIRSSAETLTTLLLY